MSLDISPKTEARLAAKAQEQGLDALLERLLSDAPELPAGTTNAEPSSTVWPLPRRAWQPSPPRHCTLHQCSALRDCNQRPPRSVHPV